MINASPSLYRGKTLRRALVLLMASTLICLIIVFLRQISWQPPLYEVIHNGVVATLRVHQAELAAKVSLLGWRAAAIFACAYLVLAGANVPINVPFAVAAGAMFGLWPGVVLAALCTSCGASIACFLSRTLLRGWVLRRLHGRLAEIEAGLAEEGWLYLLTLRLMPLVPYTLVNLVFGLTTMALPQFFAVTLLGTLPATIAFVNAGTELQQLGDDGAVLGVRLALSLLLFSCIPIVVARVNRWRRR